MSISVRVYRCRVAQRGQLLDVVPTPQVGDVFRIGPASGFTEQGGELVEVVLMPGWSGLEENARGPIGRVRECVRAPGRDEQERSRTAVEVARTSRGLPLVPVI